MERCYMQFNWYSDWSMVKIIIKEGGLEWTSYFTYLFKRTFKCLVYYILLRLEDSQQLWIVRIIALLEI